MVLPYNSNKHTIDILNIKLDFLTRDLKKTSDLIIHLQNDEPVDAQKHGLMDEMATRIKRSKINTDELEKRKNSIIDEVKTLEKEIKKMAKSTRKITIMYIIPVMMMSFFFLYFIVGDFEHPIQDKQPSSHYLIQNLKGDTINTWLSWRLTDGEILHVNIVDAQKYPKQSEIIKDTILSIETIEIDDSLLHKGPKGQTSTYFIGWKGALEKISEIPTKFYIPTNLEIVESANNEGDITIQLTTAQNGDGYSAFTKSIADESRNQILKSEITIYEIDKLSSADLSTILRHEFGHALGLAHSTAPEDLMAPVISTDYPYISECDLDALSHLYNGGESSKVVCEK